MQIVLDILLSNIKVETFKKEVDDFRANQKFFEDWQYVDRNIIKKKIIGEALALSH